MKKIASKITNVIILFCLTLCIATSALANNSDSPYTDAAKQNAYTNDQKNISVELESKIMSYDYARDVLKSDELKYLNNNNELAAKRAEKDVKYLLDLTQEQMNENMNSVNKSAIGVLSTSIALGTDKTISTCATGNKGGYRTLVSDYAANFSASGKWSDVSTTTFAAGDASAWAWVGPSVTITGSAGASRTANIIFRGSYNGGINGGYGGSSTGKVRLSVWDYTLNSELGGNTVWEKTASNNTTLNGNASINSAVQLTLQVGHTYAFRFGDSVASSQWNFPATFLSLTDFWNNGPGPQGVDATSVTVDFI